MTFKQPIKFSFSFEKFVHLIAYLAEKCDGFDILKAVKLIYFIDRKHLVKYGRPVLGDDYYHLPWGPVPSSSYDLLKDVIRTPPSEWGENQYLEKLLQYITVDKSHKYPLFVAKEKANMDYFSANEMDIINSIVAEYGQYDSRVLIDLVSKHPTKTKSSPQSQIDYRLFFEENPDADWDAFRLMEDEQEDRDFIEGL